MYIKALNTPEFQPEQPQKFMSYSPSVEKKVSNSKTKLAENRLPQQFNKYKKLAIFPSLLDAVWRNFDNFPYRVLAYYRMSQVCQTWGDQVFPMLPFEKLLHPRIFSN
jgi:hypothetical protein